MLKAMLIIALCVVLVVSIVPAQADEPLLSVSGVKTTNYTGGGLSLWLGKWLQISNVDPYLDGGICYKDEAHVTGGYVGLSGKVQSLSIGGVTRTGVGWFSPGKDLQIYAAAELRF